MDSMTQAALDFREALRVRKRQLGKDHADTQLACAARRSTSGILKTRPQSSAVLRISMHCKDTQARPRSVRSSSSLHLVRCFLGVLLFSFAACVYCLPLAPLATHRRSRVVSYSEARVLKYRA